jgi:hypothetical protein
VGRDWLASGESRVVDADTEEEEDGDDKPCEDVGLVLEVL